ncbi:MAG TPA: sialidase family protein, partial [Blastocatellia bacterium]|nr:sialidase family protein [Blastocatellia bacterium]
SRIDAQRGVFNASPNNGVIGAVHAIAPHPTNANILLIGATNGGIWKTTSATAASPTWVQTTDPQNSLSIGALEFDPTDVNRQILVAGFGRFSSFGRRGSARLGLLRSTNQGTSWTLINGGGLLTGKNISGVAPRGLVIVVSVNTADAAGADQIGVFRSTNTGATFTQVSVGNGSTTGLPAGTAFDLAGDPTNQARLFTGLVAAAGSGGQNGIYRSTNTGATWTRVSNATMNALITTATSNIEIAVGNNNNVYAAIVNSGALAGLFRSGDGGTTWTRLDTPVTHPGTQGAIHLSIVADPTNANIVYIGGDRTNIGDFGARDFSGRLFRCNAAAAAGSQCVHLTHSSSVGPAGGGTLNSSAPHADSREMVFDAAGNILEGDDGGIFRRTNPRSNQGDWFSIGNNMQIFELHSIAYDSNADLVIGGAQDNGSGSQANSTATIWDSVGSGDGGDVAVDATSTPGLSSRYSSSQNLGGFRRRVYNAANVLQSQVSPARLLVGGGAPLQPSFTTPIRLNNVNARRLIIGGANAAYESLDQGETIRQLTPAIPVNSSGGHPIAYGATGNADVLYIGSLDNVYVRTAAPPAPLVQSAAYPGRGTGRSVINLTSDPRNPGTAFVIDSNTVYLTRNAGATWTNITGNLLSFEPGGLRSNAFIANASGEALVVGGSKGVFVALASSGFTSWQPLGDGFPNVGVYQLDYNATDNILIAGTLGRGAWALRQPTFNNPAVTLFSSTFNFNSDGFTYVDDPFGTAQPNYATGNFVSTSGLTGGALQAVVGGVDNATILNMSGGWRRSFSLGSAQSLTLSLDFLLTQTAEYEADESSETVIRVDNGTIISLARIVGDGNGGAPVTTGRTSRVVNLGCVTAGAHTITIGVRNSKKTLADESTTVQLDNIALTANGSCPMP